MMLSNCGLDRDAREAVIERLSGNWRALNGGENLMALVLEGCLFKAGSDRATPDRSTGDDPA